MLYSVWFFQIDCYANGSHQRIFSFPVSDGENLSRLYVEKHSSVLRWLHCLFWNFWRTHSGTSRGLPTLQRRELENLKINPLNCEFFRQQVPFLGYTVSRDGIQADTAKTLAVRQYLVPKSVTEFKSFLGLCSYYRQFVRDFTAIARPLHQLTEKTKKIPLEPRSPTGLWTTERLTYVAAHRSFPLVEEQFILYTDASYLPIGAVLAQAQNGLQRVIWYASKSLNRAQSRYWTTKRALLALVNYTRHFKHYLLGRQLKIITDHRPLQWLHKFKDPDALTARWLKKLAAFDYAIEHRSGESIRQADCMSRLPATAVVLNMTATMDVNASVVGPLNPPQNLPSFNNHSPSVQSFHSTTIPQDTVKSNQTNDEQSGVKHGHGVGVNKNNQTFDEQFEVRNGNEAVENNNIQTDHEQSGITNGDEAGETKPVLQITVFKQQGDLLVLPQSIAYCISADFKLGARLAKQIREKFPSYFSTKKEYKQQLLRAQYLVNDKILFHLIVKPRYFH